ncbi:MAG: Gfo/Idh/MocA family protein [Sulfitobacter sp.]
MNWAMVGASTIANQYMIDAVRSQGDSQVTWMVSGSVARAEEISNQRGIPHATDVLAEALNDLDVAAVYVSSTNEKHFEQVMKAIAAGKHVLCEKPLATSILDAITMVKAAKDTGVILATNHHLRCSGSHRSIRDLIEEGQIGEVLSLRIFHAVLLPKHLRGWRLDNPAAGGGVIPDLTVHNADVVRFLLGEDPQEVSAQMGVSGMGQGVEDSAMSVWEMPSGVMVMSHESFTHPFAESGIEVHGTKGSIIAKGVLAQDPIGTIELLSQAGSRSIQFSDHSLYSESVRQFSAAAAGQGAPAATGVDGVKSLIVATAVHEAARSGKRQVVQYGDLS